MLALLLASASIAHPPDSHSILELCKPVLARKAGGEISTIEVTSTRVRRSGRRIGGRLTAFLGMGPPAPGMAAAHHLIRADFRFRCTIKNDRVREAAVNPLQP